MIFVTLVWPSYQIALTITRTQDTFQQVAYVRQQYEIPTAKKIHFTVLLSFTYNQRIPLMLCLMLFQYLLAIEIQFSTSPVQFLLLIQNSICLGFGVVVIVEILVQQFKSKKRFSFPIFFPAKIYSKKGPRAYCFSLLFY